MYGTKFEWEELDVKNENKLNALRLFLKQFNLNLDKIDFAYVVKVENKIVATVSKYKNLIKCVAVCKDYEGQNITSQLITKMMDVIILQNYNKSFLITKFDNKSKFSSLGLYEVYQNEKIIFFSSDLTDLNAYKNFLAAIAKNNNNFSKEVGIVVINANPPTKGHEYLIKYASENCEVLYVVPVLEDVSFFTYKERKKMISNIVSQFKNAILIEGSEYLISHTTFPSYFLNEEDQIVMEQAKLDVGLFNEIYCKNLGVKKRFVGDEPYSRTTNIYNQVMQNYFANKSIDLVIIDRIKIDEEIISASKVRVAILEGNKNLVKAMCPESEYIFLTSEEIKDRAHKYQNKIYKNN